MDKAMQAARMYLRRQSRESHPQGRSDNGGRWYPDPDERCCCCDRIREPSRSYPWGLNKHCRSIGHIANLFGVSTADIRKAIKEMEG